VRVPLPHAFGGGAREQRKALPITGNHDLAGDELRALLGIDVNALDVLAVLEVVGLAVLAARKPMLLDELAHLRRTGLRFRLFGVAAIQLAVASGLRSLGLRRALLLRRRGRLAGTRLLAGLLLGLLDLLLADEAGLEELVSK